MFNLKGVRPIKDSHEKWVINDETNSVSNKDFKVSSTNRSNKLV